MSDQVIVVLCTAPDVETAARLARGVVEARLAACVNLIHGVRSIYAWEGVLHDEPEVQLLIKTLAVQFEPLRSWLETNHPYDVPEVLALPAAAGGERYLRWVAEQTRPG
jgi:periplasmic divalent cation tolerance protein